MAEKVLTENEKAIKDIRRNHVIGWGLGTGLFGVLATVGIAVIPALGLGLANIFGNMLLALPTVGAGLLIGGLIGLVVGLVLAHNEKHVEKHLKQKAKKSENDEKKAKARQEEKNKKEQEKQQQKNKKEEEKNKAKPAKLVKKSNKDKKEEKVVEDQGKTVVVFDEDRNELGRFHEVKGARTAKDQFTNAEELYYCLSSIKPEKDLYIQLNGENIDEFNYIESNGTAQTKAYENLPNWNKLIKEVSEKVCSDVKVKESEEKELWFSKI